jgi:hypothetical protein
MKKLFLEKESLRHLSLKTDVKTGLIGPTIGFICITRGNTCACPPPVTRFVTRCDTF